MVALQKPGYITPEEYVQWEDRATTKHEYWDGIIVAMSGADSPHNIITANLTAELIPQGRRRNCIGFSSDQRVRVVECNTYFYPDFTIGCEEPQYERIGGLPALLNPALVVEVLSNSTQDYDRHDKYDCYIKLPSLTTYVLVHQYSARIECFTRQADGQWVYSTASTLDGVLELEALGFTLRLREVYAGVVFPAPLVVQEGGDTTPADEANA